MYHSAIPSWYGYRYQGQLAIFYAIKKIYDILRKINENDDSTKEFKLKNQLEKYALEIECMEDFAIRYYKNDSEYEYISFHQVKAGDSKKKINSEAIYGVLESLIEYQSYTDENGVKSSTCGYIHVPTESYVLETLDFKELFNGKRNNYLKELEKIILVQDDWGKLHKKINGIGKKHTAKKIIHDRLSKLKIEKTINNHDRIKNVISEINKEIEASFFPESGVEVQIYSGTYFESINEIEDEIISVITGLHREFIQYKDSMNNKSIKRKILPQLIQKITEYIDQIKKKPKSDPIIKFINIYNLIVKILEEVDVNYEAYRFRVNIVDKFPKYIDRKCNQKFYECKCCDKKDTCNIADFMNEFEKLSIVDVGRFIGNIAVARDVFSSEQEIPASKEIQDTIFKYLREVSEFKLQKSRVSAYKEKKNYWCTCEREINKKDLEEYMFNIVEVLYEADFLIADSSSEEFEVSHLLEHLSGKDIEHMDSEIVKSYKEDMNRFSRTKKIKAIDIEEAKEALYND